MMKNKQSHVCNKLLMLIATIIPIFCNGLAYSQQWIVVPSPSPDDTRNILRGVVGIASNDVWAVGTYGQLPSYTLTEHWNGANWTIVSSPNPDTQYNELFDVAGTASNNFYAVGNYAPGGVPQMLILHWNGGSWTTESTPTIPGGAGLEDIFIISPTDIYAGGYRSIGAPGPNVGTLLMHFNGSSWTLENTPNQGERRNYIADIKAISTTDIWAVGYSRNSGDNYRVLILHKTGSAWNIINVTAPGLENYLYSIDIISPTDIWASGYYNDNGTLFPLFLHYNGSAWTPVFSPEGGWGTIHNSANDIWSTGSGFVHYDGTSWTSVEAPVPTGAAMGNTARISSNDIWSVGRYVDGDALKTLTMHFTNSVVTLDLKALIQGLYDPLTNKMVKDTVRVYLRNSTAPYTIIDSSVSVLDSSGSGNFTFSNATNSVPYYLVIKHRNGLETWSALPKTFTAGVLNYDFTISVSQAFGNNQIATGTKYTIYNGDINQDGVINLADVLAVYNEAASFKSGYRVTDLNGDKLINLSDVILANNNAVSFVHQMRPGL